ncbi:helicase-exonuclease AddAB subunit AddB [Clostridium ganghwense]|uniref:ATP-dependent helicase/deoxyribonuclease subunit B n=1 Tax=Clostridium ganghwense TaxID=312089 RepID=A0ABT4CQT5_9CLOT|nr:helicase-exonuclease AddAB subunit AddB [Clostridium ganghwense]MCY6371394.1 helicase-exonuclease AddAB subunit AddB [Clostridium ganghwense]
MSLRFIYGRSGSGKSHYCVEQIKKKLENGQKNPLLLIVPEQYSFQAEKNIVEKIKGTGIINVEVTSFERMAYKVSNEVGGATRQHMDSSGKCMLIFNIINKIRDEFKVFAAASNQQGFVNTISDMITELKRYDVSPLEVQASIRKMEEDDLLKDKLEDISKIFNEFEDKLHQNYIDNEDDITLLYERLDYSQMLNEAEIWLDEFNSFTPQQYKIIEKLIKKAKRVNVTLGMEYGREFDSTDVFAPLKNTEERILKIAKDNNFAIENPVVLKHNEMDRFKDSEEIRYLEGNYFKYPYRPYTQKTKDIEIIRALNPYSEVEKVAREIVELVRDKGLKFRDIAVITRDLNSYEKIVKTIFYEYEIPCFIDKKKEIDDNPLIVLITSAIDIFNKNWSYEAVFRYLKTGLIGIDNDEIDILENYVIAYGIRGKKKWQEEWLYGRVEVIDEVNEIKKKVVAPLIKFSDKLKGKKSAKEICTALYNFLCDIKVNETIENWVYRFNEEGRQELVNEYSQIWNLVIELLDQIVEVFKEEKLELKEFVKLLHIGFGEHKMGLIPTTLDEVLVSSVERVRSHTVKALYILGVNDGTFPAVAAEEGILSDTDRDKLRKMDIDLAQDTKSKIFEEQFLIYKTLTIAGKCLRVCYPIADYEGKAVRPSIIISRLKSLFPNITEESDVIEDIDDDKSLELVSRKVPTFNKLVSVLRKDNDEVKDSPLWSDVYHFYSSEEDENESEKVKEERKKWRDKCKTIFSAASYDNSVDLISKEKIRKLYGKKLYFSVSRFEKYEQCPFAYYVQYGLNAKERRIFKLNPPDLGTFMHNIIDEFSKTVDKNSINWFDIEEEWCIETVNNIVDTKIKEDASSIFNSSPRYRYFTERLKRVIIKTLLVIVEHMRRSGFEPIGYEVEFGDKGTYPPIVIELSNGEKVKLIGRIDRVDKLNLEGKDYYRIIDYKSGNKDFNLSDVYYGLQIQLLTYLDAILTNEEIKEKEPILPGGVLYFKIDDPIIRGNRGMSEEQMEKEILKALKMKGLLLADVDVIKEMDRKIEGYSLIIPARINKGDTLGKSSVGTEEQFKNLRNHVKNNLVKTCEEMLSGDIQIKPFKGTKTEACSYCMYSAVCQFDDSFDGNKYKVINDKKDEEIWKMLEREDEEKKKGEVK